jgi:flagellar biosynthesis protein FlhB
VILRKIEKERNEKGLQRETDFSRFLCLFIFFFFSIFFFFFSLSQKFRNYLIEHKKEVKAEKNKSQRDLYNKSVKDIGYFLFLFIYFIFF